MFALILKKLDIIYDRQLIPIVYSFNLNKYFKVAKYPIVIILLFIILF